jgi:hypothetical protein
MIKILFERVNKKNECFVCVQSCGKSTVRSSFIHPYCSGFRMISLNFPPAVEDFERFVESPIFVTNLAQRESTRDLDKVSVRSDPYRTIQFLCFSSLRIKSQSHSQILAEMVNLRQNNDNNSLLINIRKLALNC